MSYSIERDLEKYGPHAENQPIGAEEARAYCRGVARSHYENFTVASWLLPRKYRQHFYNVYAYCRWADDLADEVEPAHRRRALLDWWGDELVASYRGRAGHPVFVALMETIEEFAIPETPFLDLLEAFRRDQIPRAYETFDELLGYCRQSANPVGRIVLYIGRCHTEANAALADKICTGLQLANLWQDVARDYEKGRVYLPREDRRRFGYDDGMLQRREANQPFRELMEFEVERAESYLREGQPLATRVPADLQVDIELFVAGGLAVLEAIRAQRYDVWSRRPTVSWWRKLGLLYHAWRRSG